MKKFIKPVVLSLVCGFVVVGLLQAVAISQKPSETQRIAWWGVLYPDFCVTDVTMGNTADTHGNETIRFRILEWMGKC